MVTKLVVVGLYLLVLIGIGIVASRRMKDMRDYFAAGKGLGFLAVAFSARATGESAWLLLGLTGMGAAVGLKAFWVVLGEVIGVMGAWLFMCRRFKRLTDGYDSVTVPDYLESRFADTSQKLRLVAALALVVFVTIYVSAQIDATGQAFEAFLGWNYYTGVFVGFFVVLAYILAGGFLAVAWSDVFQGALMFVGLVFLPIAGVIAAGGVAPILDSLNAIDPGLLTLSGPGGWSAMTVLSVVSLCMIGLGFLGSPQIFVRFIALKSEKEITRGAWTAFIWTIFADSGAVLIGMIGRAMLTEAGQDVEKVLGSGAEDVLPMLVEHILPLTLVAIFIAVVLSAIMSTVDSLLVLAASALIRDYYQKVRHPELSDAALMKLSRLATLALALGALAVAMVVAINTPNRTVFWFVIFGWSGISATFCPTLILSLFWRGMTGRGALWGMITGFLGVPLFKFLAPTIPMVGPYFEQLGELPPAFFLSGFFVILMSRLDPNGPPKNAGADLDQAER
jgi:sodium/proline symporter